MCEFSVAKQGNGEGDCGIDHTKNTGKKGFFRYLGKFIHETIITRCYLYDKILEDELI
ncbi:MAG: hypothetical protein HOK41_10320 [Nitrospina sp.]|nr:hypothetical protein [Nitrospina sp.]